jgi:DNA-binding NarL/FixJ family response regulator
VSAASVSAFRPRDRDLGAGAAAAVAATGADLDLLFALRAEATWAEAVSRLEVGVVVAGPAVPVERGLADDVIRTAREALTRIVRHADARTVRIGLLYDPDGVSLLVQDDGQGFDLSSDLPAQHAGLRRIADRARELGATVEIDSLPGWGSRIRARFPYGRDPRARAGARVDVVIASGRPVLRAGLARLARGDADIDVVGEAATVQEALHACRAGQPAVALVDLSLTDHAGRAGTGSATVALLLSAVPRLAVVGLCDAGDDDLVTAAMRAGASGCIDLEATGAEVAEAIRAAARGQAVLSTVALAELHRGLRADAVETPLTERERQVRALMEQGLPDKAIAQRLVLSVRTVEKHAGAVLRKTGARNRTELAALAGRVRTR